MTPIAVITTVNAKTDGIRRFEEDGNVSVVVVADRKTPCYESSDTLQFLDLERQQRISQELSRLLPFDHYSRKNIGYLWAMSQRPRAIYDTDDDNLPYPDWTFPEFECFVTKEDLPRFVNAYRHFTDAFIWPRGFPLDEVRHGIGEIRTEGKRAKIGAWQGLADEDPDVDAIYRLLFDARVTFSQSDPFALLPRQYCPFNSQNTYWNPAAFAYLYLPATVSFRFTDILRGYVAQRGFWAHDLCLGFVAPTVYQERNPHSLMADFRDEIECYLNVKRVVDILDGLHLTNSASDNLVTMYQSLATEGVVGTEELDLVDAWISDIQRLGMLNA